MKLGASVSGFFEILYQEAIDALGASTIQTFELSPKVFFRGALQDEFNAMLRDTGKKAASYHIPYGLGFDISRLDEAIRQEAVANTVNLLDHAAVFNCGIIVIHASYGPIADDERSPRIDQARRSLDELEKELTARGQRLAVELLPRHCIGNKVEELMSILKDHSDTFGVCLDTNHFTWGIEKLIPSVAQFGKRLITTHIADYLGEDEMHIVPGEGKVDWPGFAQALIAADYQGPFNYEINRFPISPEKRIRSVEDSYRRIFKPIFEP